MPGRHPAGYIGGSMENGDCLSVLIQYTFVFEIEIAGLRDAIDRDIGWVFRGTIGFSRLPHIEQQIREALRGKIGKHVAKSSTDNIHLAPPNIQHGLVNEGNMKFRRIVNGRCFGGMGQNRKKRFRRVFHENRSCNYKGKLLFLKMAFSRKYFTDREPENGGREVGS